jgi:hypothetical protein
MFYILKNYTIFQQALKIKYNDFEKTYNNFHNIYKNYLYIDNFLKVLPIKHFYKNFYEINFNKMISQNNFKNIKTQYLKNLKIFNKKKINYDILLSKSFFPSFPTSFKLKKKCVNNEKVLEVINSNFPFLINAMKKNKHPLNEKSIYTQKLRFRYVFKNYINPYKSITDTELKNFYSFKPNRFYNIINTQKIISNIENYKRNKLRDYIFLKNLFSNEQIIHQLAIYLQDRKKHIYYENFLGTNNIYNELQLYKFPNSFHVNIFPNKKEFIKEKIILPVTEALIYFKTFKI